MSNESDHICFEAIQFAAVTEKGLQDVSILTMGEARGHGEIVDEKTIEQFMQLSMGKSIPAYLTHAGAVGEDGRTVDRLGKEIGMFSGFYRDGNKVRAKNFQFLEAFKQGEPKVYATLAEMAKNFAENLGISPLMRRARVWATSSGDVPAKDGAVPAGALNKFPSIRLRDLLSCDFVQKPAANLALYEAKIDDKTNNIMSADTILLSQHTEEITSLSTQHKDAVLALETKHKDAVTALEAKVNEGVAQLAKATEDNKGLTSALAAKAHEAEEAAKYDMRKAGGEALQVALEARNAGLPSPAETDAGRWAQYAEMCEVIKDANGNITGHKPTLNAERFHAKYLSRK